VFATLALMMALSAQPVAERALAVEETQGVTREQVIAKLGDPDVVHEVGPGREDLYYCKRVNLRVMLKNGVMFEGVISQNEWMGQRAACGPAGRVRDGVFRTTPVKAVRDL